MTFSCEFVKSGLCTRVSSGGSTDCTQTDAEHCNIRVIPVHGTAVLTWNVVISGIPESFLLDNIRRCA